MPDMPEVSTTARAAHELGLAAWFGGTLFGQVALNPTVSRISDKQERGRVVNESWARFNAVNTAALAATLVGWRFGGLKPDAELRAPDLMRAKNLLLGGAAVNAVAAGILGARTAKNDPEEGPEGGTPVESGTEPAPETPPEAARSQRLIGFFGTGSLTLLAATIVVSGIIETSGAEPPSPMSQLLSFLK